MNRAYCISLPKLLKLSTIFAEAADANPHPTDGSVFFRSTGNADPDSIVTTRYVVEDPGGSPARPSKKCAPNSSNEISLASIFTKQKQSLDSDEVTSSAQRILNDTRRLTLDVHVLSLSFSCYRSTEVIVSLQHRLTGLMETLRRQPFADDASVLHAKHIDVTRGEGSLKRTGSPAVGMNHFPKSSKPQIIRMFLLTPSPLSWLMSTLQRLDAADTMASVGCSDAGNWSENPALPLQPKVDILIPSIILQDAIEVVPSFHTSVSSQSSDHPTLASSLHLDSGHFLISALQPSLPRLDFSASEDTSVITDQHLNQLTLCTSLSGALEYGSCAGFLDSSVSEPVPRRRIESPSSHLTLFCSGCSFPGTPTAQNDPYLSNDVFSV
ncbi:uncharacterized protein ARMOST_17087 [Armillaria ostoyae]|uniref:Uncharacterized protein n=1 Tax=Armillaria ostoyae TaxID=47428 RepID=A0A284RY14_ARMOS|nr:uncharacterized protein ARMOST_17087 [Armillaria ostoyae]